MNKRKALTLMSLLLCVMLVLTGCGSKDEQKTPGDGNETTGRAEPRKITYWIPKGEDARYYAEYEDNPVVQYIYANYEFNGAPLYIDFFTAPIGSEQDNFNVLLSTGEYCGVMDVSMNTGTSPAALYEQGIILDLTDLYEEYMPNYCAVLDRFPELKNDTYSVIDGEKKVLSLYTLQTMPDDPFEGYCYRRDWIAKYGKNPVTGEPFTYGFTDPENTDTWQDDIVFPSGETEPIYISDWEWMFDIFKTAITEQGISGGYCFAPYYMGYMETGDLSSSFGGGGIGYSIKDGVIVDGYTSDNARAYMQCLNNWYNNGWIDTAFAEHTNDMFYAIDIESVYQGKVGLWQGRPSALGNQLDTGSGYTEGAMVFGCRLPINDVYGGDAQKNIAPDRYMRTTQLGGGIVLTNKLSQDEAIAFMQFIDFLFTEEGDRLRNVGLNQEQYEAFGSELYDRLGVKGGNYTIDDEGYIHSFFTDNSNPDSVAVIMGRVIGLVDHTHTLFEYVPYVTDGVAAWAYYPNSAAVGAGVINAVPVSQQKTITKLKANLDHFLAKTIPQIIKGTSTYDIYDDDSWAQFVKDAQKYGSSTIAEYYQQAYDLLNQ